MLLGLWLVCGVVGPSPLLAEVPVCYSPPLLAGFRCRWRWAVPATPGCGPLAAVVCGVWCVVCGVLVGFSPLLAELPVCYSPPLLAGFRCRWWWAVPATLGSGPLAALLCGVWQWCVGGVVAGVWCGWSLATPGGGSCVLLPATPGWVSLPLVVGGPRLSWLGSAGGGGVNPAPRTGASEATERITQKDAQEWCIRGREEQSPGPRTGLSGGEPGTADWSVQGKGENMIKRRSGMEHPRRNGARH